MEAIKHIVYQLDEEKKDTKILTKINAQMKNALPLIQHDFLLNIISAYNYDNKELDERFSYLDIPMAASFPVMLLIARKDTSDGIDKNTADSNIYMIREVLTAYLCNYVNITSLVNKSYEATCFIQPQNIEKSKENNHTPWNETYIFVTGTLERVQSICRELCGITVSFALSSKPASWRNIHDTYTSLSNTLNYGFGFEKEILIDDKYLSGVSDKIKTDSEKALADTAKLQKKSVNLGVYLESNDFNAYKNCIGEMVNSMSSDYELSSSIGMEIFFMISLKLISYINIIGIRDIFSTSMDMLTNINLHESWKALGIFL